MKYLIVLLSLFLLTNCVKKNNDNSTDEIEHLRTSETENIQILFFKTSETNDFSGRLESMAVELSKELDLEYEVINIEETQYDFINKLFEPKANSMVLYFPDINKVVDITDIAQDNMTTPNTFFSLAKEAFEKGGE